MHFANLRPPEILGAPAMPQVLGLTLNTMQDGGIIMEHQQEIIYDLLNGTIINDLQ